MKSSEKLSIPPILQEKLEQFRSRLWAVKIGEGALAGVAGLIISFLVVFCIDRFIGTPVWLRVLILLLGFAVPAVGIPLRYHRWVWNKRSLGQIARVLRKRYPKLGGELLGIVDLASDSKGNSRQSSTLINAAMQQVSEKIKDQDFSDAVPENHYRKWSIACVSLAALVLLFIIFISGATQNSVARWLTPWRDIERYTFAKPETIEKEIIVPNAESFDFSTDLQKGTEWKPGSASMRLPGRTKLKSDLNKEIDRYSFTVPPQKQDAELLVRIGDAREKIKIKPVPRPELSNLSVKVRLPDYLQYQGDPVIPVQGNSVDLIEGAMASFIGTTSRPLTRATMNGLPTIISGNSFSTKPEPIRANQRQVFEWQDENGLSAKTPFEFRINAISDAPPGIFAKQTSQEQVVLPDEVLTFDISSSDDFGLREVGLEWAGVRDPIRNPNPAVGSKLVAAGEPEKTLLESRGTFSAKRFGIKPQTIKIRAYAEDYFPNRKRALSSAFVVHILAPSDHANWLTKEFGKWFSRAQEVYEREQQLHETNRALHELSQSELDRPENRRQLERQADAELSNSRRLNALTRTGKDLIRQATKNDEFDANQLESWAKMMRNLDHIANTEMPSVAELLKKASKASGSSGAKDDEAQKNSPNPDSSESAPQVANRNDDPDKNKNLPEQSDNPSDKSGQKSPSVSDTESTFFKDPEDKQKTAESGQQSGSSPLSLPTTQLKSPANDDKEKQSDSHQSVLQQQLDQAIEKQQQLLADFAKITDELQDVLASLEASTFVKRFKAASRKQLEVAKQLNESSASGFGAPKNRVRVQVQETIEAISEIQQEESDKLYHIQSDLDAYYQRKQDPIYKNVLEQMKSTSAVTEVKTIGREALQNLTGRAVSSSEFWSDTLDRWAEELVAAANSQQQQQQQQQNKNKDGLPPEVVLEVMKISRGQMDLREETRELGGVRESLTPDNFRSSARELESSQVELRERVDGVVDVITDLPDGEQQFQRELQLMNVVSDVMREARAVLARPDTGPEVIAAQTEAIELLLQSQRPPPNQGGGGGGGGGDGSGGGGGGNGGSALSDIQIRPGNAVEKRPAGASERSVGQSTGKAGQEFPEEFRNGLDTYFNELENIR